MMNTLRHDSALTGYFDKVHLLIDRLKALSRNDSSRAEAESEDLLDQLASLSAEIARTPSSDLQDLRLKAALYQALAPETGGDIDELPADERLVFSIISDLKSVLRI